MLYSTWHSNIYVVQHKLPFTPMDRKWNMQRGTLRCSLSEFELSVRMVHFIKSNGAQYIAVLRFFHQFRAGAESINTPSSFDRKTSLWKGKIGKFWLIYRIFPISHMHDAWTFWASNHSNKLPNTHSFMLLYSPRKWKTTTFNLLLLFFSFRWWRFRDWLYYISSNQHMQSYKYYI